jgi:hypothetical protein
MGLSMTATDKKLKNLLQQLSLGPAVKPLNLLEEREAFLHPRLPLRRKSSVFKYENSPLKWADQYVKIPYFPAREHALKE